MTTTQEHDTKLSKRSVLIPMFPILTDNYFREIKKFILRAWTLVLTLGNINYWYNF